jgi:hypothetical protein
MNLATLSIVILGVAVSLAGCNRTQEEPIVDFQTVPPGDPHGYWKASWAIQGQFSHQPVACSQPKAASILARVVTDDDREPKQEFRFRAACDAAGQQGFALVEPGRYHVKVELQASDGKVLATTKEGSLVMPPDGHPQATPIIFELPDAVVIKASNQTAAR